MTREEAANAYVDADEDEDGRGELQHKHADGVGDTHARRRPRLQTHRVGDTVQILGALHVAVREQRQSEERRDDPRDGDQPGGRASLGGVGRAPSAAAVDRVGGDDDAVAVEGDRRHRRRRREHVGRLQPRQAAAHALAECPVAYEKAHESEGQTEETQHHVGDGQVDDVQVCGRAQGSSPRDEPRDDGVGREADEDDDDIGEDERDLEPRLEPVKPVLMLGHDQQVLGQTEVGSEAHISEQCVHRHRCPNNCGSCDVLSGHL